MSADGPVSLEMEKYFQRVDPQAAKEMKAGRVLELNPDSGAFAALRAALEGDKERARTYAELLYDQALLIAGLPLEDPAAYTELVCSLMHKRMLPGSPGRPITAPGTFINLHKINGTTNLFSV